MTTAQYKVELQIYSGPLDLLLYLIRRNELDILDLPVATITSSFNEFLDVLELIDLDLVGDFLVMASTLAEIKSRMVLPRAEEEEIAEVIDDPRSDLIQQLLEYKKFKDAANALEEHAAEWQERYPRLSDERPKSGKDPAEDLIKEVELWDLVSALARVVKRKEVEEESSITYDDTPISTYVERIGARVRQEGKLAFSAFFEGEKLRSRITGIFLAILELLRHHHFRADQPEDYGEIWIMAPLPETQDSDSAPIAETTDASVTEHAEEEVASVETNDPEMVQTAQVEVEALPESGETEPDQVASDAAPEDESAKSDQPEVGLNDDTDPESLHPEA
ncbi:segregation and condensation protein A [Gimesia chilikensis]|uniref:segregation and condensation protein A n=1 Tax=Gimesia chilikensis TaxID=2605989 RepID=UPI00118B04D1|nr:segregation/condensation protein A [Gimesia chilikensis]QDT84900.1 Segregation and condensation protein A [Gimesia chilikensis]